MRKEYLNQINLSNKSKTFKYIKAIYKAVNENPIKFENNTQVKRMIKNNEKIINKK